MRLTKEDKYGHFYTNKANCRNIWSLDGEKLEGEFFENQTLAIDGEAINKLGQLEDIEEELGIDLLTLFRALKNGIWTNQEQLYGDETQGEIRFFQVRLLLEENAIGCIHNSMWKGKEVVRTLYFKDYGKTWALTKKELL
jgi:hypothetical protein